MAVSLPILCMAANALPLSGRATFVQLPSKPLHPFCNHLHKQFTFHRNNVGFRKEFRAFSSSAKLAQSTIVAWDAAFAQEQIPASAPEPPAEPLFISILLFAAFVGLSLVTVGVIYLGVTEFLEKGEKDKLLKEVETQEKLKDKDKDKGKGKGKGKRKRKTMIISKSGPRGFGQKIDEDD